jgi:hypothetical protein
VTPHHAKNKLVLALVVVPVLLAGGTIEFALGIRYGAGNPVSLTDLGTAMYFGMMASAERFYGADATCENSLRAYVVLLDNLRARDRLQRA